MRKFVLSGGSALLPYLVDRLLGFSTAPSTDELCCYKTALRPPHRPCFFSPSLPASSASTVSPVWNASSNHKPASHLAIASVVCFVLSHRLGCVCRETASVIRVIGPAASISTPTQKQARRAARPAAAITSLAPAPAANSLLQINLDEGAHQTKLTLRFTNNQPPPAPVSADAFPEPAPAPAPAAHTVPRQLPPPATKLLPPPAHAPAAPKSFVSSTRSRMYRHAEPRSYHIPRPPSPADSVCSSCEEGSMPINTPWSNPASSSSSLVSSHSRRRRSSVAGEPRPIMRGAAPPQPLVVQTRGPGSARAPSPPRSTRSYGSGNTILVPASSTGRERRRHRERSPGPRARSKSRSRQYDHHRDSHYSSYNAYSRDVDIMDEHSRGESFPRRGRTKFPRKLVEREAIEELGYPFAEEPDGTFVVLQALGRPEIEEIVELSDELRRRSDKENKSVSFFEKALVHEVPPSVPSPPPSIHHASPPPSEADLPERPRTPLTENNVAVLNTLSSGSSSHHRSLSTSSDHRPPPKFIPLAPAGPSTPIIENRQLATPSSSLHPSGGAIVSRKIEIQGPTLKIGKKTEEQKIAKLEEKALKAEREASRLEVRADMTRSARDEHDAFRARVRAEELKKKLEDKEWKERVKHEERQLKRRENSYRVGRNRKGEVVIIKGT